MLCDDSLAWHGGAGENEKVTMSHFTRVYILIGFTGRYVMTGTADVVSAGPLLRA